MMSGTIPRMASSTARPSASGCFHRLAMFMAVVANPILIIIYEKITDTVTVLIRITVIVANTIAIFIRKAMIPTHSILIGAHKAFSDITTSNAAGWLLFRCQSRNRGR